MLKILFSLGCALLFYNSRFTAVFAAYMFFLFFMFLPYLVSPFSGVVGLMLDELGVALILLSLWVSGGMFLATGGLGFVRQESFYVLIGALCLILAVGFTCSSAGAFYIFFELSLIPITAMVLGWGYQPERFQASNYLVLYTVTASLPLLISIVYVYYLNGHCSFFLSLWKGVSFYNPSLWWGLSILAFLVKTPMYFLHLWLPKAHVEAPVAGSMILAGVLLKLGGYGILRLMVIFHSLSITVSYLLISIALWGGGICSLICLRQVDIKALIAYSSITHMGSMVGGLMSNSVWGWQGALMMMLSHGLVSSSMFLGAYMMYKVFNSRSLYFIKGILSVLPFMSFIWFFSMSANMGVPPTLNLQSEIMLVSSVLMISKGFIFPLCISLFFSAAYSLFLYSSTQNGYLTGMSCFFFQVSYSDVLSMFLQVFPAYIFILKGGFLIDWIY